MREILFRGKRRYAGNWFYGDYWEIHKTPHNTIYIAEKKGNLIEIVPETIGQYTGLTDKNGVKIFEGDIVEYLAEYSSIYSRTEKATVHWSDSIGAFCARNRLGTDYILSAFNEVKVTGNIHANPELPEGE